MGTVIQQLLLLVSNNEWWSFDDGEVYSAEDKLEEVHIGG
jgi:hypothetical protein